MHNKSTTWLQGITILDLSALLPCPFAAHLLAGFGARVIKIESPHRPDPARKMGFTPQHKDTSSVYRALNDNKELMWCDLKSDAGRKRFYELVQNSHGAIEGYRPDVRKRLGIEYQTLQRFNPGFVLCSVTGYPSTSPHALRAGHDLNFVARSGILDHTRDDQGRVVMPGIPLGDISVAYSAALRMACALLKAQRTQQGDHIEVSIEEALFEIQTPFLAEMRESTHTPPAGQTLVTGMYPCYRVYNLKDGSLTVGALEEKFWITFCECINRRDLISKQYATGSEAKTIESEILKELSLKSLSHWKTIFSQVDCCVEPVLTMKEVMNGL